MARKGEQFDHPPKRVQRPADVRALGEAGRPIWDAIKRHYSGRRGVKIAKDSRRGR